MANPRIAVLSFPGNNGDIENLRCLRRCGLDAFVFRWNDSTEKLADADGYFIGAGFSYEDRGRAGMVAARDPLFTFLHEEAAKGKVIVGHCNGCQMLVESGLVPLGGLDMCMARNVVDDHAVGFLNEWIWITPSCAKDRCATSNWEGAMHIPIAHGEGRFVTKDPDVLKELKANDHIAFSYCDQDGNISEKDPFCPNGSTYGIAGICNAAGNVVAMMPHAERTVNGDPYFASIKEWIESRESGLGLGSENMNEPNPNPNTEPETQMELQTRKPKSVEIFIETIITNNEERTVEQAARRFVPGLQLKQYRYLAPEGKKPEEILSTIALFNPNKERAYIRRGSEFTVWDSETKKEEAFDASLTEGISLLRRDEPDTGALSLGTGSETGICYVCSNVSDDALDAKALEVFANPHASTLERLS